MNCMMEQSPLVVLERTSSLMISTKPGGLDVHSSGVPDPNSNCRQPSPRLRSPALLGLKRICTELCRVVTATNVRPTGILARRLKMSTYRAISRLPLRETTCSMGDGGMASGRKLNASERERVQLCGCCELPSLLPVPEGIGKCCHSCHSE